MKKHLITLFLLFASVVNLHAAITYERKGNLTDSLIQSFSIPQNFVTPSNCAEKVKNELTLKKATTKSIEMTAEVTMEEWNAEYVAKRQKAAAAEYAAHDYYFVEGMMHSGYTPQFYGLLTMSLIMLPFTQEVVWTNHYGPTDWYSQENDALLAENSETLTMTAWQNYGVGGMYYLPYTTDHTLTQGGQTYDIKGYMYAEANGKGGAAFTTGYTPITISTGENIPMTLCGMETSTMNNESGSDFYQISANILDCPYAYGTNLYADAEHTLRADTILSLVRNVSPLKINAISIPLYNVNGTTMIPENAEIKIELFAADLTQSIIYPDSVLCTTVVTAENFLEVKAGMGTLVATFQEVDPFGGIIDGDIVVEGDFVVQLTGYNESGCDFGIFADYYTPGGTTMYKVGGKYTRIFSASSNLAIMYDAYWPVAIASLSQEVLDAPVEGGLAMDGEYSAFAIYTNVHNFEAWMIDEETSDWLEFSLDDSNLETDGYLIGQITAEALPTGMTGRKGVVVLDVDGYKLSIPVQQGDVSKDKYSEEFISTCDSYTWNGKTYTQSGIYTYTTIAADGNDSIVTLHLTISPTLYTEETISACDSYVWNGHTYTEGGTYTYTTTSVTGCDSIVTLHLTISQSDVGETEYATICHGETYTWNGQTYSTEGEYSITLSNTNGCDSIVTLQLTILPEMLTTEEYVAICYGETYTWNAQTYATAGSYTAALSSVFGCDSTAILHLTILPEAIRKTEYISAPTNKTVTWRGKEYNEIGIYYDTVHFVVNPMCDSVIYMLDLTIADNIDSDKYCGDNLTWYYSNGALIITGSGAMYDGPDRLSYRDESWYPARVNNIVLPDAITHISSVAFADCSNLTNIVIPNRVTSIGDGAFSWTGLQSVIIPASVTELGEQVFEACNNLQTIIYEGYPTVISNQAIHPLIGCVHLDTVIAPAALWHCANADKALENRYGVPHKARYIEVTDGDLTNQAVKYIAQNATALEVLDLTNTTNTTLPYGAFSHSYLLTQLYLPAYIETLPESMIEGGSRLSEITIPATVTEIGNYAFAGCVNIWHMTVEATTPPKVYENTFDGISRSISVLVPAGSEQAYREAEYWREFFIDNTNSPLPISNCQKILREDQILILREGKVYTTMGQLINTEE